MATKIAGKPGDLFFFLNARWQVVFFEAKLLDKYGGFQSLSNYMLLLDVFS